MKTIDKLPFYCIFAIVFISSCVNFHNQKYDANRTDESFTKSLKEKQIGNSNFYISIPTDYSIKENRGPDFSTFYIIPTDTTIKGDFSCGLYFGNFPSLFPPDNNNCKTETVKSEILNKNKEWTVYVYGNDYSIQTIVENKKNEGWNEKVHAFGHGKSVTEVDKILKIYSTLRTK